MVKPKQPPTAPAMATEVPERLYHLQTPEVLDSLERLCRKYEKYAVSADEVRAMLDEALGDRALTEILQIVRSD